MQLRSLFTRLFSNTNFNRVMRNSGWLLGANTISSGLVFIQAVLIARVLGVELYGIFVLIVTYVATISQLIDSRVWEAVIKFVPQFQEEGDRQKTTAAIKIFYYVDALTAVIALVALNIFAGFYAQSILKEPALVDIIRVYSLIVIIEFSTETSSAILRVYDRFAWISLQGVSLDIFRTVGIVLVGLAGAGIEAILLVMLITSLLAVILILYMSYRVLAERGYANWRDAPFGLVRAEIRSMLSFIFYSNVVATGRLVTSKLDILILGWFVTPAQVGVYELAKRIVEQVRKLFVPVNTAVYPEISQLVAQRQYERLRSLQLRISVIVLVLVVVLILIFSLAVIWIIPLFFGSDFVAAVPLAQIQIWSLIWTPLIWFPGYLLSLGLARLQAALVWVETLIYVVLLFLGILLFAETGAALALALRFVIWVAMACGILFFLIPSRLAQMKVEPGKA